MKVNLRKFNKGPSERRLDVHIDRWDTYSLEHSAAIIILPMLIQLKQTKMGVPNEFVQAVGYDMDTNYCFDFIKDDENIVFEKGCEKWEEILNKMIWSFQQLVDDEYSNQYHHGEMEVDWRPIERINPATGAVEKMYEMVDKNPSEHWYDHVGHTLHEERIQEGLELFGKYLRNLWD